MILGLPILDLHMTLNCPNLEGRPSALEECFHHCVPGRSAFCVLYYQMQGDSTRSIEIDIVRGLVCTQL